MKRPLRRILCIDDDQDILSIIEFSLSEVGGFEVKACASGKAALACVDEFKPELFLIDVMMPEMSGPETLNALQALPEFENTPAIFLTANVQFAAYSEARPPKMLGVLTKPFDPMQLSERITKLWEEHM
ncbi:response regulator [Ignatzschineria sp. RMDPL8A]|uniref:response regulator n=1 Tax=Ignatzschineria sp. RMDPL8A TaxID=2999236 RepID=UPI0016935016|nr:response regulator [Ignatzschineria sp. RMDPL8A]MDG9728997.1 response regulator [Ignatzschineria sp. RMDPL8A]NLD08454.1 response regulator [Xanthomonadaceae bacterium]